MPKHPKPLKALLPYKETLEKDVWGPVFWKVFHLKSKKGFAKQWLDGFEASIMCPDCKEHFAELRQRFPREAFASDEDWGWLVHNMVNTERSNKPFYSYAEWRRNKDD